jgi:hypothetical protein
VVVRRDFVFVEADQLNGKWNRVECMYVCMYVCMCKENDNPFIPSQLAGFLLTILLFYHIKYIYC